MKKKTATLSTIIGLTALLVGLVLAGWGIFCVWTEVTRRALAGTECVIVASHVYNELAGQREVDEADVARVLVRLNTSASEGFTNPPDFTKTLDPWGNALSVKVSCVKQHYVVFVRSAGPDGIMGNRDDYLCSQFRWLIDDASRGSNDENHVP